MTDPAVLAGLAIQLASHPPTAWHQMWPNESGYVYATRMCREAGLWIEAARDALTGGTRRKPEMCEAVTDGDDLA